MSMRVVEIASYESKGRFPYSSMQLQQWIRTLENLHTTAKFCQYSFLKAVHKWEL